MSEGWGLLPITALPPVTREDKGETFESFLRHFKSEPLKSKLPKSVQNGIDMAYNQLASEAQEKEWEVQNTRAPSSMAFVKMAREIFDEADEDGNCYVDMNELKQLLQLVLGLKMDEKEMMTMVSETMDRFDADSSGNLDFTEFSRMLCVEPWASLLPAEVRGEMDLVCNQMRSVKQNNELQRKAGEQAEEASIASFLRYARELFDDSDSDGSYDVDQGELIELMLNVFPSKGKMSRDELSSEVANSIAKFDLDGNGTLNFTEFMKMLCIEPWRQLLPPEIEADIVQARDQIRGQQKDKSKVQQVMLPEELLELIPAEEGSEKWMFDSLQALSVSDPGPLKGGCKNQDNSFNEKALVSIWHCYDIDGNGYVDDDDLKVLLCQVFPFKHMLNEYVELGASSEWIQKKRKAFEERINSLTSHLKRMMDTDGDGMVDKNEFLAFFSSISTKRPDKLSRKVTPAVQNDLSARTTAKSNDKLDQIESGPYADYKHSGRGPAPDNLHADFYADSVAPPTGRLTRGGEAP